MSNMLRQRPLADAMSKRRVSNTMSQIARIAPSSARIVTQNEGKWIRWAIWADDEANSGKEITERQVIFHPFSRFAQAWEFVSGILLLYSAAITPLLMAFFTEEQGHCGLVPTIYMDMFVDTFFLVEIGVHFLTGTVCRGNVNLVMSEVAKQYICSEFIRDLVASAPIAWVEFFLVKDIPCSEQTEGNSFLLFMRFIRMLKMLRLIKVLKIFNVMRDIARVRPATTRLIKAGFMVFLMSHIGGCIWWFIKVQVNPEAAKEFLVEDGTNDSVASIYVSAVYFMMATLCTVGYGDIAADGDAERVLSIFTMCLGTSVFAIIVSNMSALAAGMQTRENQVLEEMDNVLDYMRQHGVAKVYERQVQNFYLFKCRQNVALTDANDNVLRQLPLALHREIKLDLSKRMLSAVWLFDGMNPEELASVVDMFEMHEAIPGEVIVDDHEIPDSLYIVVQGQVRLEVHQQSANQKVTSSRSAKPLTLEDPDTQGTSIRSQKAAAPLSDEGGEYQEVDRLGKGQVFGEVGVLLQCPCPYRARAVGFVELYKLDSKMLRSQLFTKVPDLEERLREGALEKIEEYSELAQLEASSDPVDRWYKLTKLLLKKNKGLDVSNQGMDRLTKFATHQRRNNTSFRPSNSTKLGRAESAYSNGSVGTCGSEKNVFQNGQSGAAGENFVGNPAAPTSGISSPQGARGYHGDGSSAVKAQEDEVQEERGEGGVTNHSDNKGHNNGHRANNLRTSPSAEAAGLTGGGAPRLRKERSGEHSGTGVEEAVARLGQLARLMDRYAAFDREEASILSDWAALSSRHSLSPSPPPSPPLHCGHCGHACPAPPPQPPTRHRDPLSSATLIREELSAIAEALTGTPLAPPPIHVHPSPRRRSDDVERGGIAAANGGNSAGDGGNSAGNGGGSAGNGGGSMEDGGIWRTVTADEERGRRGREERERERERERGREREREREGEGGAALDQVVWKLSGLHAEEEGGEGGEGERGRERAAQRREAAGAGAAGGGGGGGGVSAEAPVSGGDSAYTPSETPPSEPHSSLWMTPRGGGAGGGGRGGVAGYNGGPEPPAIIAVPPAFLAMDSPILAMAAAASPLGGAGGWGEDDVASSVARTGSQASQPLEVPSTVQRISEGKGVSEGTLGALKSDSDGEVVQC